MISCNNKPVTIEKSRNDSLKKYFKLASDVSLTTNIKDSLTNKTLSFVNLEDNDTVTRFYLAEISKFYLKTLNFKGYNKVAKIHLEKSILSFDTLSFARYYRYKGGYFRRKGIYDSSFYYYLKAEKYYSKLNIQLEVANINLNQGLTQYSANDFLGAELSLTKAYHIFKNSTKLYQL